MTLFDKESAKEDGNRPGEACRRKARKRLTADRAVTTGWDIVGHHKKEGKTSVTEGI